MIFFLSHWRSSISWWFFVCVPSVFCLLFVIERRTWICWALVRLCPGVVLHILQFAADAAAAVCVYVFAHILHKNTIFFTWMLFFTSCYVFSFFFLPTLLLLLLSIDRDANILLAFISTKHLAAQIVTTCAAFWATFSTVLGGPRM